MSAFTGVQSLHGVLLRSAGTQNPMRTTLIVEGIVERNVFVSNLMSFLAATMGIMIGLLSKVPNAQKATSYDEE